MRAVTPRQRLAVWSRGRAGGDPGGGGGSAIGTTSTTGHVVIIPMPSGFLSSNPTIVDPSKITVASTMPTLDGSGNLTTTTISRRCGFAAEVVGTDLHIWMRETIKAEDTAISLSIGTGAITNGAQNCPPMFGTVTNAVAARATAPKTVFRLLRTVDTAGSYGVENSVIDNDFYIEGAGGHLSRGLAGVKFDVVQGGTTVTSWALQETRSRVQDEAVISDAQWSANGNRGLGVWSSGLVPLASFADGQATITATAYSLEGAITRVETWTVYLNRLGTYIDRVCYVDSVAGLDTNDGLTAATAFQTLQKGCLWAGSATGSGLSAAQIKVRRSTVKLVGGTDATPRVYELYSGTGTGNAIPNGQDTWLTIQPAEGFSGSNTWIAAYTAGGLVPRIRRLRFRNLWIDVADASGAGGTSSRILLGFNSSVNPADTDPVSVWFDNCDAFHHLGRTGQLTEVANSSLLSTTWDKRTKAFFTRHTYRDWAQAGHRCTALSLMWDVKFQRIGGDVFKEPDCLFGWYQSESGPDKQVLPINTATGTPLAGDTITGVYSSGTATVASVITTGTGFRVVLNTGAVAYTFKADDSKQCRKVTLTGVTGSFTAGQTATFAGVSYVIGRVEGSDLYLRTTTAVGSGAAVVGPSGTATTSGASVLAECLLFSPSGARGRAGPPHPDLQQIQDFKNQSFSISGVSGTFTSAAVTVGGLAGTVVLGSSDIAGGKMVTSGTVSFDGVAVGATITQASSGASAVYQGNLDFQGSDVNMLLANGWADNAEGQMLFSENGSTNVLIYNVVAAAIFSSQTEGNGSTTSTPGHTILHCSLPNQNWRLAGNLHPNMAKAGRRPTATAYCVAANFAADQVPQGATSGVDAWCPGSDIVGCVAVDTTAEFSAFSGAGAVSAGVAAGWVDGIGAEDAYDAAAAQFAPDTGSTLKNRLPAGVRPVRYDVFGNERPIDGTGAAGAAEVWNPPSYSGTAFKGQSINTSGGFATYASPPTFAPDSSPEFFTLTRQGFDATGAATTYTEDAVVTKRIRQAYPNNASLTTDQVSLSTCVYSTDTVLGATNNSTRTSPKPIANWARPDDHVIVGNTFPKQYAEIVAGHRNGRNGEEIRAVKWIWSDGTNTVTRTESVSVVSDNPDDFGKVIVYRPSIDVDISSLTQGSITMNAEVYPWIGAAASVLKSVDSSVAREFSPRIYQRTTTAPFVAFVRTAANGGNDGTGVVNQTVATASANPFATILAAINALHTAGGMDNTIIYIGDDQGTPFVLGSPVATRTQTVGECVITRESGVARANARVSWGALLWRCRFGTAGGWVRFKDVGVVRTGTAALSGEATSRLTVTFEGVTLDAGAANATMLANADLNAVGVTISNIAAATLNASAAPRINLLRGVIASPTSAVEGWRVLGCHFTNMAGSLTQASGQTESGVIIAFNRFTGVNSGNGAIAIAAGTGTVTGVFIAQNLFEYISATAGPSVRISADSTLGSTVHVCLHHNTTAGFFNNGRDNTFYDEGATPRTNTLMSVVGNISVAINTKGDVFVLDGSRVGNWDYLYGVDCRGELSQFIDANSGGLGGSFAQNYPGLNCNIGTSNSVRNNPLFTTYAGTTSGPTAGAGGGVYSLQSGSPCEGRVKSPPLRFDFAGNARNAIASATGAYRGFSEAA